MPPRRPSAPKDLGEAGAALWRRLWGEYEFLHGEVVTLELACRQRDDLALVELAIEEHGATVEGSKGQLRMSPFIAEARQQRIALARLLDLLALPHGEEEGLTPTQRRAKKAADARWSKERDREAGRDAKRSRGRS